MRPTHFRERNKCVLLVGYAKWLLLTNMGNTGMSQNSGNPPLQKKCFRYPFRLTFKRSPQQHTQTHKRKDVAMNLDWGSASIYIKQIPAEFYPSKPLSECRPKFGSPQVPQGLFQRSLLGPQCREPLTRPVSASWETGCLLQAPDHAWFPKMGLRVDTHEMPACL